MTIVGRITRDAVVNTLKDERKVVNFSVAINETYKTPAGEKVKTTTYCNCSYWISDKIAELLKKATLVEVSGRIYVSSYTAMDGTARASLNCHVNQIKIHAWQKHTELIGSSSENAAAANDAADDLPF
jgi:single-strand DNA-binding protein